MFKDYLKAKKSLLDEYLIGFLEKQNSSFKKVNFWGEDLIDKLKKFVITGKTIRGILVFLSAEMFGFDDKKIILPVAAAMELIQSSLLIHDDIMDRDLTRRGAPSMFATYLPIAKKEKFSDSFHFAVSMGICAGDLGFFLALKLINSLEIKEKIATEIMKVCLAQMADVYWGYQKKMPAVSEVEKLYLYKTARYSFSLPLAAGAILANQPKKIISMLEKLGEYLGVAFQIKNDIKQTGKSTISDIRENKKTLIRLYDYKKEKINNKLEELASSSKKIINQLPVKQKHKELLLSLISKYLLS